MIHRHIIGFKNIYTSPGISWFSGALLLLPPVLLPHVLLPALLHILLHALLPVLLPALVPALAFKLEGKK